MREDINYEEIEPAEAMHMATKMIVAELREMRAEQRENTDRLVEALASVCKALKSKRD